MSTAVDTTARPSRAEIDPAALDLVRRHGAQIMATARRYAATPEDAEDAYQRGLEILLTKAPSTDEDDLVPWLKTVVKHEAFALRKQRERHGVPADGADLTPSLTETHEQVERLDRLQRGAEAMRCLKPQEMRCLLLLAEGYSYRQICEITGFTYTKVNRCLAEGRQRFLRRIDGIESGDECRRLAPLLSAAADGEADADDLLALRRHMRGCLACRATLRQARKVPARVAAVAPAGLFLAPGGSDVVAIDRLHTIWNWIQERLSTLALRGHELAELATAHKAAAVAASAAALAGGGAAAVQRVADDERPRHDSALRATVGSATHPAVRIALTPPPEPKARPTTRTAPQPAPPARSQPASAEQQPTPPALPSPAPPAPPSPAPTESAPAPARTPPPPSGEFGP